MWCHTKFAPTAVKQPHLGGLVVGIPVMDEEVSRARGERAVAEAVEGIGHRLKGFALSGAGPAR